MKALWRWIRLFRPRRGLGLPPPRSIAWVLVAALGVRLCFVGHDLPDTLILDEWDYLTRAYGLFGGHLDPHWYGNPPGFVLAEALAFLPMLFLEFLTGRVHGIQDVRLLYTLDKTPFFMAGRLLSVACGIWAVLEARALAGRLGGPRAGRAAAALLAFSLIAVEISQRAKNDALALALALATLASLQKALSGRGSFLKAGLWLGLAVATKRHAVLLVLPAAITAWSLPSPRCWKALLGGALGAVLACLAVDPWPLLRFRGFIEDMRFVLAFWGDDTEPLFLRSLLSVPALVWAGLLLGLPMLWRRRRPMEAGLAAFAGAAWWVFGTGHGVFRPDLLLPASAAGGVLACAWLSRLLGRRAAWLVPLALASLSPDLASLGRLALARAQPTTLQEYRRWAMSHLPDGARIAAESYTDYLPTSRDPAFGNGRNADLLAALRRANGGKIFDMTLSNSLAGGGLESLRKAGVRYVVVNSRIRDYPSRQDSLVCPVSPGERSAFYRDLSRERLRFHSDLRGRRGIPPEGPEVWVYELGSAP